MSVSTEIEGIVGARNDIRSHMQTLGAADGTENLRSLANKITTLQAPQGTKNRVLGFTDNNVVGEVTRFNGVIARDFGLINLGDFISSSTPPNPHIGYAVTIKSNSNTQPQGIVSGEYIVVNDKLYKVLQTTNFNLINASVAGEEGSDGSIIPYIFELSLYYTGAGGFSANIKEVSVMGQLEERLAAAVADNFPADYAQQINNAVSGSIFQLLASGWVLDSVSGKYEYTLTANSVNSGTPEIYLSGSAVGEFATSEQESAFKTLASTGHYAETSDNTVHIFAKSQPATNFYVLIRGVQ